MNKTHKTAYLWGPLSSFSAPLAAWLLKQGWHLHVATKSSLDLLTMSSLELASSARALLADALGGLDRFKVFQDRLKILDQSELSSDTKYDAIIFCGLPPNFDEARVPRAPWAAKELLRIATALKGVPIFIVSSLWGAVQKDRVVPEELEFDRRKALTHWERICQAYEKRLTEVLTKVESNWYFVRIPMLAGATADGAAFNVSGPSILFRELDPLYGTPKNLLTLEQRRSPNAVDNTKTRLAFNPDSTLWFLPVDTAVYMFWRFLEDGVRPRICNLVSTQANLNREWLNHLASSLGLAEIVPADRDSFNLPNVLRKLLLDEVQVRTRNLFEVAGRYQLTPLHLDKKYFDKILSAGRSVNWGVSVKRDAQIPFSPQLARYYFEEFFPSQFDAKLLRRALGRGTAIGFRIQGLQNLGWLVTPFNNDLMVEPLERARQKPCVCFSVTSRAFTKIIEGKWTFAKALLLREIEVEGTLLDAMRVTQAMDVFVRKYSMSRPEIAAIVHEPLDV